jgi:hypothetical protein
MCETFWPRWGVVVAATALSAAEGSGSRRSTVYVGFPLCACAPYGRCEARRGCVFQGNRPIEQPKAPKIPVGSQSSRRLAALGAPAARKTRPSSFDTCQVKVQHLIRALPRAARRKLDRGTVKSRADLLLASEWVPVGCRTRRWSRSCRTRRSVSDTFTSDGREAVARGLSRRQCG